ncbi:MAG: N-acetyl-alpha-D-glucosaminyl L-malate synthase BshA [Candidatus Eremiobacteraeota bacterium]|nr:N-acetyl-alpha-D-glucosaminyl L-malate synthase BshA [Candidatus Eremiobacteraeota bacterium]
MKIGIVCFPTYGGSGAVAGELARGLALRGHEIHIISYALPFRLKSFTKNVFFHEVDTQNYPPFPSPPYVLSLASRIIEICMEYSLDVLHLHYAIPHTTSAFLARCVMGKRSPALITTLHGTDITLVGSHPSYYPITKFSIEESDGITSVSSYLKKTTEEVFGIRKPIEVIHNFIDTGRFSPGMSREIRQLLCGSAGKVLIHISNFRPVKRLADVVQVFARVAAEVDAKLLLVGDGEERPAIHRMVGDMGIRDRVLFLGKQDNVEELIATADLMLFPSENESFGLAALEALSCGVPVVGSTAGGLVEVVEHGLCGYLHPVGDVESMARSCLSLLGDSAKMEAFREKARERALSHFDERIIIPHYENFYRSVINGL